MSSIRKEYGITMPFEQNGTTAYGKSYTAIELDIGTGSMVDDAEVMMRINNSIDDLLIMVTDASLRRTQAEYMGEVLDGGSTVIDVQKALQIVRENLPDVNLIHTASID